MGCNVIEFAKNYITSDLINKASSFLDENEHAVNKAIAAVIPTVLSAMAQKSSTTYGTSLVAQAATMQAASGVGEDITIFFGNEGGKYLNHGAALYNTLFGNNTDKVTQLMADYAAIKPSSAISLFSMAVPMIYNIIGKYATQENITTLQIASFIGSQQDEISNSIPAQLNLTVGIDGNKQLINTLAASKKSNNMTTQHVENTTNQETDNGLRWLLPILLLIFLAALCWYFMGTGNAHPADQATAHTEEHGTQTSSTTAIEPNMAAGTMDSLTQNFIYNIGRMVSIELPNNAGKLEVGEFSTEHKLYKFLSDKSATIDTVKGNWFEFTNVRFKTGATQVDSASLIQLKNMVLFCKGFPTAQFKIGGYTDNSGDTAKNILLSQKRADAVLAEIIKQGAAATSFTGAKGYGPEHPIGDNATPEGKAMNRRVAVNVKAK